MNKKGLEGRKSDRSDTIQYKHARFERVTTSVEKYIDCMCLKNIVAQFTVGRTGKKTRRNVLDGTKEPLLL